MCVDFEFAWCRAVYIGSSVLHGKGIQCGIIWLFGFCVYGGAVVVRGVAGYRETKAEGSFLGTGVGIFLLCTVFGAGLFVQTIRGYVCLCVPWKLL